MSVAEPTITEAMALQAIACERLGSDLYASLLRDLLSDFEAGGLSFELLHARPEAPWRDALLLRFLGAVHRIVLRGDAPTLAARYPSAGGDGTRVLIDEFLAAVAAHHGEIVEGLGQNVQTNEVGRCTSLIVGFAEVARRARLPLSMLELGASGGLISNWDRYAYDEGTMTVGDPTSRLRFAGAWDAPFDLSGLTPVVARRGCDINPLDTSDPAVQLRLLSYLWPDQRERFARLRAALDIAEVHRPVVDTADAGEWLAQQLADRTAGAATIVFHSIVWQYLPKDTKDRVRDALRAAGAAATPERPLAWARLEPAGEWADVRLTYWPGGRDEVLALGSFHGGALRRPLDGAMSAGHAGVT